VLARISLQLCLSRHCASSIDCLWQSELRMLRESLSFVLRLIFPCVGICYRRARGTSPASPCPASAYQASPYPESPYQASPYQASPYQPGPPQQGPPLYVCLKDIEGGPNNDNHLNSINISSPYRQIPKAREQPTNLETRAVNQWLQAIDSSSHWSLGESHLSASEHTQASLQASSDPPQEGLLQLDQKTRTELSAAPTQNPPPTTTTVQSFICSTCSRQFLRRSLLT
jgi:hypothetical protein